MKIPLVYWPCVLEQDSQRVKRKKEKKKKNFKTKQKMSKKSLAQMLKQARPFLYLVLQQFGYAGMSIISKFALNQGMSQHVLVVYRHAIAAVVTAPFAIVLERYVSSLTYAFCTLKRRI